MYVFWCDSPQRATASLFTRFLDHTQRHTTVGRTPLDEWSARRRDLYLTTQNTHNRQTSMHPVGFEPTVSAGEQPQTYALDRAATGNGTLDVCTYQKFRKKISAHVYLAATVCRHEACVIILVYFVYRSCKWCSSSRPIYWCHEYLLSKGLHPTAHILLCVSSLFMRIEAIK